MYTCKNCDRENIEYEYIYPDDSKAYLCDECAINEGFCTGCGWMMAGSEMDENSGFSGLCYDCVQEMREELGEFDEDDYGY